MSLFDLGYDFSRSAGVDETELARQKKLLKCLTIPLQEQDPAKLEEILVDLRGSLSELYKKSDRKIQRQVKEAGLFSADQQEYCQAARLFVGLVTEECCEKITRMEERKSAYAAVAIAQAEIKFGNISVDHCALLETMQIRPN